jgi:predicted XRE-type DNA-binding protein
MKPVTFLGRSLEAIRSFPRGARREVGFQIDRLQRGLDPDDWKPLKGAGSGVREIRVRDKSGVPSDLRGDVRRSGLCAPCISKKDARNAKARHRTCGHPVSRADAKGHLMTKRRFDSVWDAIEKSPADAAAMKARADLMMAVREAVDAWGSTQSASARKLGVSQPRLNGLLRGRIDKFSLEALVTLAGRAGLTVRVEVERPAA